jgi:nucleotide-binding universal stress UspA family protein
MSAHEPDVAFPGTDALDAGDGPSIRRVLVPVRSPGKAAEALSVAAWRADVIVLTRRPRPAVARLFSGSVPDKVMRTANCPVLAVHPGRE